MTCACKPKPVYKCGKMTLPSTYSKPHPCEKEVSSPGQTCAHHPEIRKRRCHRRS